MLWSIIESENTMMFLYDDNNSTVSNKSLNYKIGLFLLDVHE